MVQARFFEGPMVLIQLLDIDTTETSYISFNDITISSEEFKGELGKWVDLRGYHPDIVSVLWF